MRILITGETGYVGISLKNWLFQWSDNYQTEYISLRSNEWKSKDFSTYNVVIHVAAIVHKKEQPEMEAIYYRINRDLTIELANKAKSSGVEQFIFMSTIAVYGLIGKIGEDIVINRDTPCIPSTLYGKSKLEAEIGLSKLNDANFKVAILRAPMVYGPNCPGNYGQLRRFVSNILIFPLTNNKRSMIFIDNLSEFIRLLIDNQDYGLFFPQNEEYVNTSNLVELILRERLKNIYLSKVLLLGIKLLGRQINIVNKVFGNLVIDSSLSNYAEYKYCVVDFLESIKLCEKKWK